MIAVKPRFDRKNFWPWCRWMTVGIGVLATSSKGKKEGILPDTVILIADTMGSYEDLDSHARLHKLFLFPEVGMFATAANKVDRAGELLSSIEKFLRELPQKRRSYGNIMRTIQDVCFGYKRERFCAHELPKLRLSPQEFDPARTPPHVEAKIQKRWDKFSLKCDLVIGAFTNQKGAVLIQVLGDLAEPENMTTPGIATIGIGGGAAAFWLSRREQVFGNSPLRSAYHAYEAKQMAESSAHVNKHVDILVATNEDFWFSTSHPSGHPYKKHPQINPENLREVYGKHGPQDTSSLDALSS
jgi:hypothetical protein